MKKLNLIINPVIEEGEKPGQFLEISIKVFNNYSEKDILDKIHEKLRYTIESVEDTDYEINKNCECLEFQSCFKCKK